MTPVPPSHLSPRQQGGPQSLSSYLSPSAVGQQDGQAGSAGQPSQTPGPRPRGQGGGAKATYRHWTQSCFSVRPGPTTVRRSRRAIVFWDASATGPRQAPAQSVRKRAARGGHPAHVPTGVFCMYPHLEKHMRFAPRIEPYRLEARCPLTCRSSPLGSRRSLRSSSSRCEATP